MDSVCGEACKAIIDAAAALVAVCDPSNHKEIHSAATHAVEVVCFG
jgi:hypothetical protein